MIGRIAGLIIALLLISLTACSRSDGQRILGHWRAESLQVQSFRLPMGPEFVVTPRELQSVDGDIRMSISSIQSEGDVVTVTLGTPFSIGLSFYFESSDRIYFDLPLAGRVYFQRVAIPVHISSASVVAASQTSSISVASTPHTQAPPVPESQSPTSATEPPIVDMPARGRDTIDLIRQAEQKLAVNALVEAEALLSEARRQYGDDPMIDYYLAVLRMRQGDPDAAVRKLRDAFQNDFRDFKLLESSIDLASLRQDPRYQALVTRYR